MFDESFIYGWWGKVHLEKKGIAIKCVILYIHKENELAKRGWRILVTMKNLLFINNDLLNNFWVKAMETTNYLRNRLPTRSKNHSKIISKKIWTGQCEDFSHVCIFNSLVLANILKEKKLKSDFQKVWQGILIGYSPDTTKYFRVWALQIKQIIITYELYIDELKQGAKLLEMWPVETLLKRKPPVGEPRPRSRLYKYRAKKLVV